MDSISILKDAVKYPFSDWRKFLILGFIILIVNFSDIIRPDSLLNSTNTNLWVTWVLSIIGGLFLFLVKGYLIRIIKFSFEGMLKFPEFKNLEDMFIDGIKFFIVTFVYSTPIILIILIFSLLSSPSNPSIVIGILEGLGKWLIFGGTGINDLIVWMGTWFFVIILYMIFIIPVIAMAIAHMAINGKLNAAFKFNGILNIITSKGWIYLITWYLVTLIFFLIFAIIGIILTGLISKYNPLVGTIFFTLILTYLYTYFARSVALFYIQNKNMT